MNEGGNEKMIRSKTKLNGFVVAVKEFYGFVVCFFAAFHIYKEDSTLNKLTKGSFILYYCSTMYFTPHLSSYLLLYTFITHFFSLFSLYHIYDNW
jgi:hypothetical protein